MYSFKEKNKLYYDLQNADFAVADLNLLCKVSPTDQIIERAKRNPERHFKEVLYRLLDLQTADEIRLNRRSGSPENTGGTGADDAALLAAKKAEMLAKMAAGRVAAKAKRDAAKLAGSSDPKVVKESKPKAVKAEKAKGETPETPKVPVAEEKTPVDAPAENAAPSDDAQKVENTPPSGPEQSSTDPADAEKKK